MNRIISLFSYCCAFIKWILWPLLFYCYRLTHLHIHCINAHKILYFVHSTINDRLSLCGRKQKVRYMDIIAFKLQRVVMYPMIFLLDWVETMHYHNISLHHIQYWLWESRVHTNRIHNIIIINIYQYQIIKNKIPLFFRN